MDQEDRNVRDEAQSKRRKLMDELELDIPEWKAWFEHSGDGSGMCKAGFASDDAPHMIFLSIVGGYNMSGIVRYGPERHHGCRAVIYGQISLPTRLQRLGYLQSTLSSHSVS